MSENKWNSFFDSLPEWAKKGYLEDHYVYQISMLVLLGHIKTSEEFFEKLAKALLDRAQHLEKVIMDHHSICMPPILVTKSLPNNGEAR